MLLADLGINSLIISSFTRHTLVRYGSPGKIGLFFTVNTVRNYFMNVNDTSHPLCMTSQQFRAGIFQLMRAFRIPSHSQNVHNERSLLFGYKASFPII